MREINIKLLISKLLLQQISKEELIEFKEKLKSDPALIDGFNKEVGFFTALKNQDDLDLEQKLDKIFDDINQRKTETKNFEIQKNRNREKGPDREL